MNEHPLDEHPVDEHPVDERPLDGTERDEPPLEETESTAWDGLRRRRDDRVVAGVASGIAERYGLDPTIVRIAFVVLAVMGGIGVLVYVALWLLMPDLADTDPLPTTDRRRTVRFWVGMLVLGGVAAIVVDGSDLPSSGWLLALLLIGIGVALWKPALPGSGRLGPRPSPRAGSASVGPRRRPRGPGAQVRSAVKAEVAAGVAAGAVNQARQRVHEKLALRELEIEARRARPRSYLGRLTIGVALIAGGVATSLERADVGSVSLAQALGLSLAVIGGGLLVGTFFGRARWLIVPALALTPVVAAFGTLDHRGLDVGAGVGERRYAPSSSSVAEEGLTYEHGIGTLSIDLTGLDLDGLTVPVYAELAIGSLVVHLPPGVEVYVDAQVAAGEIDLHGERTIVEDGLDRSASGTIQTAAPGAGRLELYLATGMGEVQVHVDSPPIPPIPLPADPIPPLATTAPIPLPADPIPPVAPIPPRGGR